MSHELRTPLTAVLGLSETLQMGIYGTLTDKQLKALGTIRESGQHLLDLITDILDLSKLEAGKLELQLGLVMVPDVCQASLMFIKQQAHRKDLRVQVELDSKVRVMQADARRLKQMLVNLLSNAVKFTPAGGKVGLKVEGDGTGHAVHFVIWDTGIGIAPENQSRLFQPFTQIDSRLAREYEGTGLGLSLVQRMAELHSGSVAVESDGVPGKGSRFTLTLPWRLEEEWLESVASPHLETETPPILLPGESRTKIGSTPTQHVLLLADDNADTLFALSGLLQSQGYDVHTAGNGGEAIAQAQTLRPDAILLDIQMPGMDGFEVLRRLRADPEFAATPIVALTALAMPGDRERCLEAGATDYLSKPVDFRRLSQLIPHLLKHRGEPRQS
jgi:CheY-like chemotaxis protein/anti-sigma regulatory factor (Ser/Thr protein kinase)